MKEAETTYQTLSLSPTRGSFRLGCPNNSNFQSPFDQEVIALQCDRKGSAKGIHKYRNQISTAPNHKHDLQNKTKPRTKTKTKPDARTGTTFEKQEHHPVVIKEAVVVDLLQSPALLFSAQVFISHELCPCDDDGDDDVIASPSAVRSCPSSRV